MLRSSSADRGRMLLGVSLTRWLTGKVNRMGSISPKWSHVQICLVGFLTNGISNSWPAVLIPHQRHHRRQAICRASGSRITLDVYFPTPTCAFIKAPILCYTAKYLIFCQFCVSSWSLMRILWKSEYCIGRTCPPAIIGCLLVAQ